MDRRTAVAKKLRILRENSNFSQADIAAMLGMDRSTYAYYETGKTEPSLKTIVKLAELYKVSR